MRTVTELLTQMHRLGIKLWAKGDRLRYNAPQGAMTPALIAALKANKAELLQLLTQPQREVNQTIQPISRTLPLPLSFAQQQVWVQSQLDQSRIVYNMPSAWRLTGQLEYTALAQSLSEIIRRHESLRTTFTNQNGHPVPFIHPPQPVTLLFHNLRPQTAAQQQAEVQRLMKAESEEPFDLSQGPLLRGQLLQLAHNEHILLLTMHHIVIDGWSIGLFHQELATLYAAYIAGSASPLSELPIQYADFAHWQRQQMEGATLNGHLDYWRRQLADAPTVVELPTDRPRPALQSFYGNTMTFQIDAELTERLKALNQATDSTLFMTLLAAFNVLIFRYTGQEDILVGSPIANRHRQELEGLIGFFVNTLVSRTQLHNNPSFTELLSRVRQSTIAAYEHQALPFERLVEELQLERDPSRNPLIQIWFAVQNAPAQPFVLSDLQIQQIDLELHTVKWDLAIFFEQSPEGLQGSCEYNTALFDDTTIQRLIKHLRTLLAGIVAEPTKPIAELPLLTETERHQILVRWNNLHLTGSKAAQAACIHHLIEEQAAQQPDAIALRFEEQQLTYCQLNQRANQLAHHLRTLGVGDAPEMLVGLCLNRSPEMIVGLLAILKAGGAYVPLDPALPQERLAVMIKDAQLSVLVTEQSLVDSLPSVAQTVCLDDNGFDTSAENMPNMPNVATPNNLVVVIYTSGSTGQPKGVAVEHRQLFHYVSSIQAALELPAGASFATVSTLAADLGNTAIFPTLCTGGTLVIFSQAQISNPERLADDLTQQPIDGLKITPSHLKALLSASQPARVLPKERLVLGGEALSWELVDMVQQLAPNCRIFNHYGPTEGTIGVLTCPISNIEHANRPLTPPLGRPLANTQIYILDDHRHPVPVGVPGELYIGGAQVARGYLNRPELTNERFVAIDKLPFAIEPLPVPNNRQLYKTGDRTRYLPNGNIEFLGRRDDQVKIRGFRVELGEIEAALISSPAVREAVVIMYREDDLARLIAYVVPEQAKRQIDMTALRDDITRRLPEYMVPATFISIESIPLTVNGKVDRNALPNPDEHQHQEEGKLAAQAGDFVAPTSTAEKLLAEIWRDLLKRPQIGIHDNFFQLGGDSILSIQAIARAHQAGLHLPINQVFQHPTIAGLAGIATLTTVSKAKQGIITGSVPLTPIQQRFFASDSPEPHHFNMSAMHIVPNELSPEHLRTVLQQLLTHHDALRLRFTRHGEGWQQKNAAPDEHISFEVVDLSAAVASPQAQSDAITQKATVLQASLNLSEGPLLRMVYFRLGADKPARLLTVVHHLVIDGVSWRILLEDMERAYRQLAQGQAISLPDKTTSFKAWATWLFDAGAESVADDLPYWQQLARAAHPPLPVDQPNGQNRAGTSAQVSVSLSIEKTQALLQEAAAAYNTQVNDLLLTALLRTFTEWTGTQSLLFELEGHGREALVEELDLSRTVGWFTSIFPVHLTLTGDDLGTQIKSVKEQLRQVPNRGVSYGILRYLGQEPLLQTQPPSQVAFNYLGQLTESANHGIIQGVASEEIGPLHSHNTPRPYLIHINGIVWKGKLQLDWLYSRELHEETTITQLANRYIKHLEAVIDHCLSPEAGGFTPSDFPEAALSAEELDELLAELG